MRKKAQSPTTATGKARKFTPQNARNALGVAKVVAPTVIPLIAPYAVRAASAAREAYDRHQARKLGVPVDQISKYPGRGGALLARISGATDGLAELRKAPHSSEADIRFADTSEATLQQLSAAVRAAERMPSSRRKAAHRAADAQLSRIENQLLKHLNCC